MIPFTIELNGVKVNKQIPTSWDEVTFDQYLRLFKDDLDAADKISIFTDVDRDVILKAKITGAEQLFYALDFSKTEPIFDKMPDTILGVQIPKDITYHALGPFLDSLNIIINLKNSAEDWTLSLAKYVAIYVYAIQQDWHGYDYEKAMLLLPEIMKLPAREVAVAGSFFIIKLAKLNQNTEKTSPTKDTPRKKSKRGTKS
jgi:hypothetical protein